MEVGSLAETNRWRRLRAQSPIVHQKKIPYIPPAALLLTGMALMANTLTCSHSLTSLNALKLKRHIPLPSHSLFLSFQHGTYSYRLDSIIKRTRGLELGLKHPTPFWPQESTPHQPASSLSACRRPSCGRREGGGGVISRRGDDDAAPPFRLSSEADHDGVQKILVLGSAGTGSANSGTVHGHEPVESSHRVKQATSWSPFVWCERRERKRTGACRAVRDPTIVRAWPASVGLTALCHGITCGSGRGTPTSPTGIALAAR